MSSRKPSSRAASRRRGPEPDGGRSPGKGAWFDAAAADRVCQFFTLFLSHTKGEWAGQPLVLDPWQRRILRRLFGWKRPDGMRWFRRLDLWIPRKNGKSLLAAGIALYLLFADNEPGAEVYLIANDREQASIVFKDAARMVEASPELAAMCQVFNSVRTRAILYPETLSSLQALSSLPGNKDGLNPSGVIFDELHEMRDADLWDKMTTGSGARRQPLFVVISTAGDDLNSIGRREYMVDKRILEGKSRINDRLVVIYEAAPEDDWRRESTWKRANPGWGKSVKPADMRSRLAEAREDPSKEVQLKRYNLNIWTNAKTNWINMDRWDACGGPVDPVALAHLPCWIGLDLSKRSDITAAVALFRDEAEEPRYLVLAHFFVPEEGIALKESRDGVPYREWAKAGHLTLTPGNVIQYSAVRSLILDRWARAFQVREIAYDPYNATHLADELRELGLNMVEFQQVIKNVAPPTGELKNLVLQARLVHGGNPVLRWMAENVAVIVDVNGNERFTKKASTARIDGMAALVNALGRASVGDAAPSVYEQRGVLTL
ncbi:MAG: terminase large subunit [Phycisphaerales bacterium]